MKPLTFRGGPAASAEKEMFFGSVVIAPINEKPSFSDVVERAPMLFTRTLGV
jgi:hypothetical protein